MIVAILRKALFNPNNRALRPAIGLLWTKCLSFTLRVMLDNSDLKEAWTLWFMLAPCTLWRQAEKENNSEWEMAMAKRMLRWMDDNCSFVRQSAWYATERWREC
jgi:hypothetical protein